MRDIIIILAISCAAAIGWIAYGALTHNSECPQQRETAQAQFRQFATRAQAEPLGSMSHYCGVRGTVRAESGMLYTVSCTAKGCVVEGD